MLYKIEKNKGFTRIQNVMIVIVATVLIAVGVYAFIGYNRSSYQVKANHTASKVYGIVQEYLTFLDQQGQLEEFNIKASHFGGVVNMKQQKKSLKSRYHGSNFKQFFKEYEEKYRDIPVRYIILKSENNREEENPIYAMFENQLLDDNIIKHTFLIEYNGNTGQVLNVFYSEKTDDFVYKGETNAKNNVILRDAKSLNRKWQGYYGIDLEGL